MDSAAPHLEAAGQHAIGLAAARDAVLHGAPDAQQAGIDLGVAAPVALVAPHQLGDAAVVLARERKQVGAAVKRIRQHRRVGRDHLVQGAVGGDLVADDEAAADRVVGARLELGAL